MRVYNANFVKLLNQMEAVSQAKRKEHDEDRNADNLARQNAPRVESLLNPLC
jgi:hypothetical protein